MFHSALILSIILYPVYFFFGDAGTVFVANSIVYLLNNPITGSVCIILFALAMKYINIAIKNLVNKKKKVLSL